MFALCTDRVLPKPGKKLMLPPEVLDLKSMELAVAVPTIKAQVAIDNITPASKRRNIRMLPSLRLTGCILIREPRPSDLALNTTPCKQEAKPCAFSQVRAVR